MLWILRTRITSSSARLTAAEYVLAPKTRVAVSSSGASNTRFVRFMCIVYRSYFDRHQSKQDSTTATRRFPPTRVPRFQPLYRERNRTVWTRISVKVRDVIRLVESEGWKH